MSIGTSTSVESRTPPSAATRDRHARDVTMPFASIAACLSLIAWIALVAAGIAPVAAAGLAAAAGGVAFLSLRFLTPQEQGLPPT